MTSNYLFRLRLFRKDHTPVGSAAVGDELESAAEWVRFHHQRKGSLPFDSRTDAMVLPLWHAAGEPLCSGFRIEIPNHGKAAGFDFANKHLIEAARAAALRFRAEGKLSEGEAFEYMLTAYPAPPRLKSNGRLDMRNASPGLTVESASLARLLARATAEGTVSKDEMPVFIPRRVLDEATLHTTNEHGTETGGILIGKLECDPELGEIFALVSAQIFARHTVGSQTKLTFTAETWAAADDAIRLRNSGEIYLGYWHSHPVAAWCRARQCSIEKQRGCVLARDFFSNDDEMLLRAAFPRAYSIGLVANDTAFAGVTFSLFGYRETGIEPRGLYLLEDNHA